MVREKRAGMYLSVSGGVLGKDRSDPHLRCVDLDDELSCDVGGEYDRCGGKEGL